MLTRRRLHDIPFSADKTAALVGALTLYQAEGSGLAMCTPDVGVVLLL